MPVHAIAEERHRIISRRRAENSERMRIVDVGIAVAPGIERIAVAGDMTHDVLDGRPFLRRQRRKVEARVGRDVEDEFSLPARPRS